MTGGAAGDTGGRRGAPMAVRAFLLLALLAGIIFEAYYIVVLRNRTERQAEELRHISMELESLRNEKAALNEELTTARRNRGDDDELSHDRKHP